MDEKIYIVSEAPGNHYYQIRPKDIELFDGVVQGGFGKYEIEAAAGNLVRFCQRRGGWYPFTIEELLDFYKEIKQDPKRMFYGLAGPWEDDSPILGGIDEAPPYLVLGFNGMYYFTELFIKRCLGTE